MLKTREKVITQLLRAFRSSYNITEMEESEKPLVAFCEYFEHMQKYVLSKKAELWSAKTEEFLYVYNIPHLTLEEYRKCQEHAYEDGMKRLNIGPGHMYSYITVMIVADFCDEDARKALVKSRIHKSFQFSFRGWMDYHAVLITVPAESIETNRAGKCVVKTLKKVLD